MLLTIIMGVLVTWQAFVVPEPLVTYRPGDIRNNRSEKIRRFLMDASNYPMRNRSDLSQRVHKHPDCKLVTRHTFKTNDTTKPWSPILSYYCHKRPPEIPQPVMGMFGLRPYKCKVCCARRVSNKTVYQVKPAWPGTPCSHRMRCNDKRKCENADLDNLPKTLPQPFWDMVQFTWKNLWTG
uniref:Secreted protein n=1 Tax=Ixodes ricinus TaxID=34613 RepID=A0A0K8RNP0_IXORI